MPIKKETKEKQVKGDEAEEMVLSYMKEMNRPYASADVVANLKNQVPKTTAVKILATLAEKGQLTVKTYGKQLLYLYNQSLLSVLDKEELSSLDGQIKSSQSELEEGKKSLRHLQCELASKTALPKTTELEKEIGRVKSENSITLGALIPFRGTSEGQSTITPMSAEDIQRIDKDFMRWRKEWVDRRKVYKEFISQLIEFGQVSNISEFEEELGVDKDDQIATEVEQGEFCKPPAVVRARLKTSSAKTRNLSLKRTPSAAGAADEDGKKKKAKKV
ncbi:hypothetical protein J008_01863 [Cryptococcus neoformans]|nr:hypothetical protein C362_01483 [Cryptococcus neoformans var. grubii Bt1]OXG30165.1 hypothetical protein C367_01840 [Cryptococcus neoformans var. grubii Ze90-1]OXH38673.1 hypothetical protein J008_01863 [Cryptococcus neoformans var. grubii]